MMQMANFPQSSKIWNRLRLSAIVMGAFLALACASAAAASSAYVRVNQVGYETGNSPFQAYLSVYGPGTGRDL